MINYTDFLKTVDLFRGFSLKKYEDDIDLMPLNERAVRLGSLKGDNNFQLSLMISIDPLFRDTIDHIVSLLKTPRLLKLSLRRILSAWEHLHGEIDFDDLFVATVLRFSAPEAYDFLLENMSELQALQSRENSEEVKKMRGYIKNKWELTSKLEWNVEAAERLIAFLFPAWDDKSFRSVQVPQGIRNYDPTNYWQRVNAEFLSKTEIPDQDILHALKKWKLNHNDVVLRKLSLPEALYSLPLLSPKVEQFARYFLDAEDIRKIAASLFKIILQNEGAKANIDSCPAFVGLWRLSTRIPMEHDEDHWKWVLDQILYALPLSLRFSNDMYHYWRHNRYLGGNQKSTELRTLVISNFKVLFVNNPGIFIPSLDPIFIYCVYHFAVVFSNPDQGGDGFEAKEWKWLANLLVDAAKIQPQIVLPQIVPFIINSPSIMSFGGEFKFNSESAVALFDDRLPELMDLLADTSFNQMFDENALAQISFAKHVADEWIKKDT